MVLNDTAPDATLPSQNFALSHLTLPSHEFTGPYKTIPIHSTHHETSHYRYDTRPNRTLRNLTHTILCRALLYQNGIKRYIALPTRYITSGHDMLRNATYTIINRTLLCHHCTEPRKTQLHKATTTQDLAVLYLYQTKRNHTKPHQHYTLQYHTRLRHHRTISDSTLLCHHKT